MIIKPEQTIHNYQCDGRSVWNVINSCDDFKGKSIERNSSTFTEMTATVLRKTHRNIVLALDMSEGMKKPAFGDGMSFARFEALNKAAMQFIESQLGFQIYFLKKSINAILNGIFESFEAKEHKTWNLHIQRQRGRDHGLARTCF